MEPQSASTVLMIRPAAFAANLQTLASNRFQQSDAAAADAQRCAVREFDALASALERAGVRTLIFDDAPTPHTPDAVFPNNWVSFHHDGAVVLYPMLAQNRRLERRQDILEALSARHGLRIARVLDLTGHEAEGRFLEGTGSLVLDRMHRIAYACLSPRTHPQALGDFAQQLDYDVIAFEATDRDGAPIYHTNVMMCVGTRFAAVCAESIREDEREPVLASLRSTGRELIELRYEQMLAFAGNMLELRTGDDAVVIALSQRALDSLDRAQRAMLREHGGAIVAAPIPTIEHLGGGSVRCMLAEVHLPAKAS